MKQLAEDVADLYRLYCPKDTWELHDSIHVVSESDGMKHHVVATAPHAEPVEFGSTHHGPNGTWTIPPNPAFRKAIARGKTLWPGIAAQARARQGYHRGSLMGATFE